MFLKACPVVVAAFLALVPAQALAQNDTSRDALARLEETLRSRIEREGLSTANLMPAIVVSVTPAFEETRAWYPTAALGALVSVFGAANLRSCEACMAPRTFVEDNGSVSQSTTSVTIDEIVRLDAQFRGTGAPARTAIWLDENANGVSLRIIDLSNSRIVLADNFDPALAEGARTRHSYALAEELDRRSRGDSVNHAFFDLAIYPNPHVSFDWLEQWGINNTNLSGLSVSLFDPVLGIGGSYFRVVPNAANIVVGGKLLMSFPTAIVRSVAGSDVEVLDPLVTAVAMARLPIARSNFGFILSASTNGRVGLGFSFMNSTFMPFLP
ncbi:MAG: hypothetical protein SF187_10100 [Deltaproteobacteria bacterium]|nr:hypothetical protein [Deltaproteobacteria bacterium]